MKNLKSFFLFFLFPLFGFAQSINGIYTGVLSNDSNTVRKDQSFEMALTEYKGKVFGYAYSTFIVNDTLYYIVKRVKGKINGSVCEVEDDEVISHNFRQKPEKKVFVTYTLHQNKNDSTWTLDGNWKTNATKKYYAVTGKVDAKEEKDLSKSKLYEHLGDLNLQQTLAFNKPKEPVKETKTTKPNETKNDVAKNNIKANEKKESAANNKPANPKPETRLPDNKTASVVVNKPANQSEKKEVATVNTNQPEKKDDNQTLNPETQAPDGKTASIAMNNPPAQTEKKVENTIVKPEIKTPETKTNSVVAVNNPPTQSEKKDVVATNTKSETRQPDNKTVPAPINNQPLPNEKKNVVVNNTNPVDKKPEVSVAKPETKLPDNKPAVVAANNQPDKNEKKNVTVSNTNQVEKKPEVTVAKPETKLVSVPVSRTPDIEKKDIAATNTNPVDKKADAGFEFAELKRTNRRLKPAAALVDERATVPSETIYFKSDSLSLALYDNGEVDGDTVSVIINDEMFILKQGLKSSAFRKTFYVPAGESDSLLVVLFADNLGKYPPNTGLLQIKDGDEISYVRFKADLDRNAAIVLRRKYK